MPLIYIDMMGGKPPRYHAVLRDTVYQTLHDVLAVPREACHEVVTEHEDECLDTASNYAAMQHTGDAILVRITFEEGPTLEQRRVLYTAIVEALEQRVGLRAADIAINLLSVQNENWYFGNLTGPTRTSPSTSGNPATRDAAGPVPPPRPTAAPFDQPSAHETGESDTNDTDHSLRGHVHGTAGFSHRQCNSRWFRG